jgi:heat shock protein HtpX
VQDGSVTIVRRRGNQEEWSEDSLMFATGSGSHPVLVYNRIARNRRRTWFLVAASLLALAPFVGSLSYVFSKAIVLRVRPESRRERALVRSYERMLKRSAAEGTRTEWDQWMERSLEEQKAKVAALEAGDWDLMVKLMPVFGCALVAAMGILFWGIASSPTSKLLVQVGAQPAGEPEAEAKRLLENLAIGAGLPVPKLYVIETSVPNAFAAGMDPQHAVVAVTRGALNLFSDKRELEGVLAHEMSHIGNHDIRLNTIVASIALFLRIPYLMFRREMASGNWRYRRSQRGLGFWELVASPIGIYILFIAPLLAALIRAAVSREREFLADADAALLTRYPEGLARALAKIGGAGSQLKAANPAFAHFYFADPALKSSWFSGNLMATHPPITERIERLVGAQGTADSALLESVKQGKSYGDRYSVVTLEDHMPHAAKDELAALNQGNLLGRVYRVVSPEPVAVYDLQDTKSAVLARVKPGSLIVVFDDPGKMRQVNTADQTFGYLDRSVKLAPVNHVIPAEVYDPKLRAAVEAALPPLSAALQPVEPAVVAGLSRAQVFIALGFAGAVFAGMLVLLVVLGK